MMDKRILLKVIIIFALIVNVASAETIILDNVNEPAIPDGFEVTVTTDSDSNTMRVEVTNCPDGWTVNGIDKFYNNLDGVSYAVTLVDGTDISSSTWSQNVRSTNTAGFGTFLSGKIADTSNTAGISTDITLTLSDMDIIPANANGHKVAVHMRLLDPDGKDSSTFLTDIPSNDIPEFPTIALPVAAILGLMFIIKNRRKEE